MMMGCVLRNTTNNKKQQLKDMLIRIHWKTERPIEHVIRVIEAINKGNYKELPELSYYNRDA